MVRVAIDASPLLVRSAGVKNYLYYWILHLRRLAGGDAVYTVPRMEQVRRLTHEGSVGNFWTTGLGLGALAVSNYTGLPALDWLAGSPDVFHASVLVRRPPRGPKLTATIHDMTAFILPRLHPGSNREAEQAFASLARRADALIAVSEVTKQDAVRVLGIPEEKITVIHSGIPHAFFSPEEAAKEVVRKKYGLRRQFVLFVGTIEPRKNIGTLLDAIESLPATLRQHWDFVVAGPAGWASRHTMSRLRNDKVVRYLGYVEEAMLPGLTAAASVFVYPSLYEGFGFPVVQAMAAGVPVITSNVSALPEIAGEAALLVDPQSQSELHHALSRLMTTEGLRTTLGAAGRQRAERFHWEKCAEQSLEFFRNVIG
jgi:alpha-1,3-rhamnosyl/mannosyltransferase